jgi:hypothetical protein
MSTAKAVWSVCLLTGNLIDRRSVDLDQWINTPASEQLAKRRPRKPPLHWFFIQLYRWFPSILQVLTITRPETLVRWHRAGFRSYWRWKSRPQGRRPQIHTELRALIRRMSVENPLWGAPRIHGELLKLGLRSRSRASPSTWSNDAGHPARDGGPSCATMRRTSPPWTCSLFQLSVSTCSMPSSLSGSTAETSSGSTSQQIRRPNGLHVR